MTTLTEQIKIISELGDRGYPNCLTAEMDGTKPDCPITFCRDGVPVFSMGAEEVADFCKEILKLVP